MQITMNGECASRTSEINDIFDAIVFSEESIVNEAFEKGLDKGIEEARAEGYHVGFHKGIEIGSEIGYYKGIVDTLLALYNDQQIDLSDKVLSILNKLKPLLDTFPRFNCSETDILQLKQEIKTHFKQFCSLMKFNGTLTEKSLSF
ncbi:protein LTO1 homolog [Planococcus citri]|uniref:protein LTO1 homolog n=1 Tax=Planococcus citri TaxID=170843 RepID=UPI0031F94FE1